MDKVMLCINSKFRTSGSINSFSIEVPWPYIYNPNKIRVNKIVIPSNTITTFDDHYLYITSNIIGGVDNGYIVSGTNLYDTTELSYSILPQCVIAIVPMFDTPFIYETTETEPYFISAGSEFSLQSTKKTLSFSIKYGNGNLAHLDNNWMIILECCFKM